MIIRVIIRIMGVMFVCFDVFCWGVRDDAWMNSVIIPDENARTVRNGNQADFLSLNIVMAMIRDTIVIEIAIFSGFNGFIIMMIMMAAIIVMFPLLSFDLQNQCFFYRGRTFRNDVGLWFHFFLSCCCFVLLFSLYCFIALFGVGFFEFVGFFGEVRFG